jgi:transcriptional regulator with XRE-family HTH domain
MITTAQIRGARGILNWSQGDLSERTDISATSIGSIENGLTQARESTLAIIQKTFEDAGIEFLPNDGIRKKTVSVDILKGREGFQRFSERVYEVAKQDDRDILQAFVDDIKFADILGDEALPHVERIESTSKKKFKIIQRDGDIYFPAKNYAEYRWISSENFVAVPFMVFGDSFAVILYEPDPTIIVMSYPLLATAYRMQFSMIWDKSVSPPKDLLKNWVLPKKYQKIK